jgi:hypothetical protein
MPQKVTFARVTRANPSVPGEFIFDEAIEVGDDNPNYYKGKVIVIINEFTQSQAEFTTMAFRNPKGGVRTGCLCRTYYTSNKRGTG